MHASQDVSTAIYDKETNKKLPNFYHYNGEKDFSFQFATSFISFLSQLFQTKKEEKINENKHNKQNTKKKYILKELASKRHATLDCLIFYLPP